MTMRSANLFKHFQGIKQEIMCQERNSCQFWTEQRQAGNWINLRVCLCLACKGLTVFVGLAGIQVFAY